jgi:hypothetical protein
MTADYECIANDIGQKDQNSFKIALAPPNQGIRARSIVTESQPSQTNKVRAIRLQANEGEVPEWLDLRALVKYASVSERTLRLWIHRDHDPLPAVRITGKVLVNRHRFDEWLTAHALKPAGSVDVTRLVNDLVKKVSGAD